MEDGFLNAEYMRSIGSLSAVELEELTLEEFGKIKSADFTELSDRGINSIAGQSPDNLVRLFTALQEEKSEDWKPDLCAIPIRELIEDHMDRITVLLLGL
ncbi:MAG: hypothetical protein HOJ16_03290 [Candidatus Peribacter sp.]|jgi:hypothetical protein|nr:hypothetical protein [Candidatus Peribacter sp.]